MPKAILPLFLATSQCVKANASSYETKKDLDANDKCGCNCRCGTVMGMLLANEVGLLGSKIHMVKGKQHTYLAVGNQNDWQKKQGFLIETTERNLLPTMDECQRQFREILEIQKDKQVYTREDYLRPDFYSVLLRVFLQNGDKMNHPRVIQFLGEILQSNKMDNLWGFMELRTYFYDEKGEDDDTLKDNVIKNLIRLVKEEAKQSTRDLFWFEQDKWFQDILNKIKYIAVFRLNEFDLTFFQNLLIIAKRVNADKETIESIENMIVIKKNQLH